MKPEEKFNNEIGKLTNNIQESISDLAKYVVDEDINYENLPLSQKMVLLDTLYCLIAARDTLMSLPE